MERILRAVLDLTGQLDLPDVLQDLVDSAARLTAAPHAALAVLDNAGDISVCLHAGTPVGDSSVENKVLEAIPTDGHVLLEALDGVPVRSLLGVPVRLHHQVFGKLFVAGKSGDFTATDVQTITLLAQAGGVAIANARVYAQSRNRERWMQVSQAITTTLLEGTEEEEALQMIAQQVRDVADADTCLIVLPSVADTWACEIVDGARASELIGIEFPPNGRALTVLREGVGVIVDSLHRANPMRVPQLREFGAAMYAPMMVRGTGLGVIILLRAVGRPEFESTDLMMAESLALQVALGLQLAEARHSEDLSNLLAERQRIGRDLHDLAIQQLFATGMQLDGTRQKLNAAGREDLAGLFEDALVSVDESVRQIRSIVRSLREPEEAVLLAERLRREASIGRTALGFAPSLVLRVDDTVIDESADHTALLDAFDARIDSHIADDLVAVVREGLSNAARHAHASSVQVRIVVSGSGVSGNVVVEVEDDGVGMPSTQTRRSGLDNLAARARGHHGTFLLTSLGSGRGSLLSWLVPLT